MRVDDNEIRKTLIKEFIKKYWKNFIIGVLVVLFLASVIIFMSKQGAKNLIIQGTITNLIAQKTANNQEEYFLEIELESGKIVNVKIEDTNLFQKNKKVKLKKIKNEMLQVEVYQFVAFDK